MENENSVCFSAVIEDIKPIEGAERLVQAVISGWECVIQKDKYNIGDKVVIATTDAVIPFELAESLGVTSYLKNRRKTGQYTVKTTKLRGVYSQAMIVDDLKGNRVNKSPKEGQDMMKVFGIEKYEEPVEIIQVASGKRIRYQKNEHFHIYTKFPNAKNVPNLFQEDDNVILTRKIHGCNARWSIVKKSKVTLWDRIRKLWNPWAYFQYIYGSHNVEKGGDNLGYYGTDLWKQVGDKYDVENKLWTLIKSTRDWEEGVIIYGEIYGPSVQKYYEYGEKELKLKIFDIKQEGNYLPYDEFQSINSICFQLPEVEVLYRGKFLEAPIEGHMTDIIPGTKVPEEGVICRTEDMSKIAKYVSPLYLEFQSKKEDSTDFH